MGKTKNKLIPHGRVLPYQFQNSERICMCKIYISHFKQSNENKYQTQHQAGLSLLRHALKDYANLDLMEDELEKNIEKGNYGKPFLRSYPHIHYNISNCQDIVVCAVSKQPVGVDIEKVRDFNKKIIRKVLTSEEQLFLQKITGNDCLQQEWFFRFWTLKESFIKHCGQGLSMPLTDVSFSFDSTQAPYGITCSQEGVFFYQEKIENQYILSLCTTIPKIIPHLEVRWY